jgi:hypothetical protein
MARCHHTRAMKMASAEPQDLSRSREHSAAAALGAMQRMVETKKAAPWERCAVPPKSVRLESDTHCHFASFVLSATGTAGN